MSRAATDEVIAGRAAISVNDPGTPVPEGWARVRLTDVARLESGHTPSRKHPEWWNGDVPWLSLPDAREHHGGVILDTTQKTNAAGLANSAARLLPKDTVCLSRTASVGYVVQLGRPMATSQDFVNWVPSKALDPRFLSYALLAEGKHLLNFGMGTTHTTIYFPAVQAFHLTLAPLPEQRRIVEKVEALLEQVNRAKARLERVPLILKRFRQSVLAAACTGQLTGEGDATDWPDVTVDAVATVGTGATPLRTNQSFYSAKGTPWITSAATARPYVEEAQEFLTDAAIKAHRLKKYLPGTLLVAMYGEGRTRGQVSELRIAATINQAMAAIVVNEALARKDFVKLALQRNYLEMRNLAEGGNQPNLNLSKIKTFVLRLPSLSVQDRIIARVSALMTGVSALEAHLDRVGAQLERLPQTILSRGFSGQLVPTEADLARAENRAYESATDLLARVTRSTGEHALVVPDRESAARKRRRAA